MISPFLVFQTVVSPLVSNAGCGIPLWLNKLNQFDGNFERAEMVKAFITSGEYRALFARWHSR